MLTTTKQNYDKYPFVRYQTCTRDVQKVYVTVVFLNIYFIQNHNLKKKYSKADSSYYLGV